MLVAIAQRNVTKAATEFLASSDSNSHIPEADSGASHGQCHGPAMSTVSQQCGTRCFLLHKRDSHDFFIQSMGKMFTCSHSTSASYVNVNVNPVGVYLKY